ncbi:MAG: DNA mismatch repair endonuclease MutL [Clostridia bacterium]
MGKIRMLSDSLIGKIAAGEVVERPVSALKELIENSLDAGATAVTAEIREGGLSYIRVTDNGCGIEESDLRLAFERHATSKISKEPDLYSIQTLGFRGEALASIAAVSHVVMTTRTKTVDSGLKVTNEGGKILKIDEAACTVGTTITVTDLFFNTPVRKGFMKKASTEASAVYELMNQFVLSRPDVSFRYISDGKTMLHSPGDGQLASAVVTVFGAKAAKTMRKVDGAANGILLKGYVGIGENGRGNRGQEYFFINGRMMHSGILSAALETACRERVMIGKFPVCALQMTIAYEAVDVNVHPNKLEVRFRDEAAVSDAVTTLVLEALKDQDAFEKPVLMELAPKAKTEPAAALPAESVRAGLIKPDTAAGGMATVTVAEKVPEIAMPADGGVMREAAEMRPFVRPGTGAAAPAGTATPMQTAGLNTAPGQVTADRSAGTGFTSVSKKPESAEQVNTILPEIRKTMKVFGALFNTFILVEYEDQLLMVDQHAVHERLLFDRLMAEHAGQNMGQELLVPLVISVSGKEMALIEENREVFESIGLVMERFGEHEAAVRTIPMVLGEAETEVFIREVLDEMERCGRLELEKKRAEILQTACKHAIKGGEALTEDQLRSILDEMLEKKVTPTCPHGRPLVVAITHRELDRKFKRIQT